MNNAMSGIGFFITLLGFAGLAESFQGNGSTGISVAFMAVGIIIMATQTIIEFVEDVKREKRGIDASYPCYLSFRNKGRH